MNRFQGHTSEVWSVVFSPDGRSVVSGSDDGTTRIWDMMDGSSKILATPAPAAVAGVAISSDGRLVAAGSYDGVRDLSSFIGVYSECNSYRWYVFGTLAPVNCRRCCEDTEVACTAWRSPLMGVDW